MLRGSLSESSTKKVAGFVELFYKRLVREMERAMTYESDHLNLKATELRLGLPGTADVATEKQLFPNKRSSSEMIKGALETENADDQDSCAPPAK